MVAGFMSGGGWGFVDYSWETPSCKASTLF